ncbi:unnamed protein product [Ectocarpus sp. 6 AP-2014]
MGNVLDCSTDPLDQIHEPDGNLPTEIGPTGSDDARSQGSSHFQGSHAGGERGSPAPPPRPEVLFLEEAVPLRDSIMWKLQREYYTAHHVQCWEKMVVPCFVTSNSFIARAYARILVGFMRDWFLFSGRADQSEPLLILEIGAGHGKFSCLVLQHLLEMREFLPTLAPKDGRTRIERQGGEVNAPGHNETSGGSGGTVGETADQDSRTATTDGATAVPDEGERRPEGAKRNGTAASRQESETVGDRSAGSSKAEDKGAQAWKGSEAADGLPFRYVVTDVAQGTLDYVRHHPSMQGFLKKGVLEVALLDAEDPSPPSTLLLQVSGQVVDLKSAKNPVATVCNYVFDSLLQDAFRLKGKTLYENRVTITATKPLPENLAELSLTALQGLGLQWEHRRHALTAERARAYYAGVATGEAPYLSPERRNGVLSACTSCCHRRHLKSHHEDVPADGGVQGGQGGVENAGDDGQEKGEDEAGRTSNSAPDSGATESGSTESGATKRGAKGDTAATPSVLEGQDDAGAGNSTGAVVEENLPSVRSPDSDFDDLLASYVDGAEEGDGGVFGKTGGSLLMPLGALRLLRHLSSLSGGRGLVLVGDKGYMKDEEMAGDRDPHIAYHGSLSCMVNLDALARYTHHRGGWSLSSPYMEGFKCQALAFGMEEEALQETRFAFEGSMQAFGPESFSMLQRAVKDEVSQPSLGLVVQLLRLSRLDPDVFMKFRTSVVDQVSSQELSPSVWEDLKKDTTAIAQHCYPLQQGKDVNFEAARLLMALKDFEAALVLFRRSDSVSGEHHVTCHNMGMSYFYLGRLREAKECFERSLELDETYDDSIRWLEHVQRSLAPPSVATPVAGSGARLGSVGTEPRDPATPSGGSAASSSSGRTPVSQLEGNLNTLSI